MRLKFDGFFKTDASHPCVLLPKINTGSIKVNQGGCFGETNVEVIPPHLSVNNKDLSEEIAKKHTYSFKI